nr:hypothetical protein [uncultured archaeon]
MINENKIRKAIRKHLFECGIMDEMMIDEERLTNEDGLEKVRNKENFIGSHCWGESFPDKSYITVSYGQQFPLFLYDSKEKIWYENNEEYTFDGEIMESTEQHRALLKPTENTHLKSLEWMLNKLEFIKKRNNIITLSHLSVEPGTKN